MTTTGVRKVGSAEPPALENLPKEAPINERTVTSPACRSSGLPPIDHADRRNSSRRELLGQALSSRGAVRKGFLLREVLGPPVSLRGVIDDRPS